MRVASLIVMLGFFAASIAQADLPEARALLFQGDVVGADDALAQILASPPTTDDEEAHALRSVTRVLRAIQGGEAGIDPGQIDSVAELLDGFAFDPVGRLLLGWTSSPPRDVEGHLDLPADSPTGSDVERVLDVALLSEISGALEDLATLDSSFSTTVTAAEAQNFAVAFGDLGETPGGAIVIDAADARLYEAALGAAAATILVSLAYDLDFDLDQLTDPQVALDIQQILDADPALLTLEPDAEALLETARQEALAAIDAYLDASERIRARPLGTGLFHLKSANEGREAELRARLLQISASLSGCFELPFSDSRARPFMSFSIKPCTWLGTGTRDAPSPRALLPTFDYDAASSAHNSARVDTLPDPTFGGVLVDAGPSEIVELSHRFLRLRNDRWQDAIEIGDGVVEGTTIGATPDGSSQNLSYFFSYAGGLDDVWYRYTAGAAMMLRINDCWGDVSAGRTAYVVSVHSGGPGTVANQLVTATFLYDEGFACQFIDPYFSEYLPPNQPAISVPLTAGQSVLIRVARLPWWWSGGELPSQILETFSFRVPEPGAEIGALVALFTTALLSGRRRR